MSDYKRFYASANTFKERHFQLLDHPKGLIQTRNVINLSEQLAPTRVVSGKGKNNQSQCSTWGKSEQKQRYRGGRPRNQMQQ